MKNSSAKKHYQTLFKENKECLNKQKNNTNFLYWKTQDY